MHETGASCRAQVIGQTASGNKKQIRDIYRRIDALAASLKCGARDGDMLSPEHQKAIIALARCVNKLCGSYHVPTLRPIGTSKYSKKTLETSYKSAKAASSGSSARNGIATSYRT